MHEYSIVRSILDRVESEARWREASSVNRVRVRIGELAGVEIDLLRSAFAMWSERSVCAGEYPVMFRKADLVVLTKMDLLPHLPEVRVEAIADGLARTLPEPRRIPRSAVDGQGIDRWLGWLDERREAA